MIAAPQAGADGAGAIGKTSARILVAEDVYMNQIVVEALLKSAGHHVTLVANGAEAVEAVQARGYGPLPTGMAEPAMDGTPPAGPPPGPAAGPRAAPGVPPPPEAV